MTFKEKRFAAQGQYAESMLESSLGDIESSIRALELALEIDPEYAPAIMSMGSVEYQRKNTTRGKELFLSLVSLPAKAATIRFPKYAVLHQGLGCCAGHEDQHDVAIAASEAALELDPKNQEYVNDLGWSLYEAGFLDKARQILERAVAMDPSYDIACENLRLCKEAIANGITKEK